VIDRHEQIYTGFVIISNNFECFDEDCNCSSSYSSNNDSSKILPNDDELKKLVFSNVSFCFIGIKCLLFGFSLVLFRRKIFVENNFSSQKRIRNENIMIRHIWIMYDAFHYIMICMYVVYMIYITYICFMLYTTYTKILLHNHSQYISKHNS